MSQARPTRVEIDTYSEHFVMYGDQSKAWRKAFPSSTSTPENINKSASKFHKIPDIRTRVEELEGLMLKKADDKFDMNSDWLLGELKVIHELDFIDIIEEDMKSFRPINDWPKEWRTSISGIDMMTIASSDENIDMIVKKIKWPDKAKNLEMIGRHVKVRAWDKETQVINNNNIMPVPTADSIDSWEEAAQAHQERVLKDV